MLIQNKIPWTKLENTNFWNSVWMKYSEPAGRTYHNIGHVAAMYNYAQKLKIPYSVELDVAILIHDMVYDKGEHKEIRSGYEFVKMVNQSQKFGGGKELPEYFYINATKADVGEILDLVNTTIAHIPITDANNDLILLDLYGFATDSREMNYKLIFDECLNLYGNINHQELNINIMTNLTRIGFNISTYLEKNKNCKYEKHWQDICKGIYSQTVDIKKLVNL